MQGNRRENVCRTITPVFKILTAPFMNHFSLGSKTPGHFSCFSVSYLFLLSSYYHHFHLTFLKKILFLFCLKGRNGQGRIIHSLVHSPDARHKGE